MYTGSVSLTQDVIQDQLAPNESILWSGQPPKGIIFRGSDLFLIPFSLLWGGFAFFWESSVLASGASFFFGLWGIPFVLVGLYMIVGRFFVDALQRDRTTYAVTNQRIIIVSGLFSRKIKSLTLRTLNDVSLDERADRYGTITFGPTTPMAAWYSATPWAGNRNQIAPSFERIPDAKMVYDTIRVALAEA